MKLDQIILDSLRSTWFIIEVIKICEYKNTYYLNKYAFSHFICLSCINYRLFDRKEFKYLYRLNIRTILNYEIFLDGHLKCFI